MTTTQPPPKDLGEFEDHPQLVGRLTEAGIEKENEALTWAPIS